MNYLQKKKLAFMSVVNSVKGFVRNITGVFPLTLTNCVDSRSIIDYTMYGNSVQNGTPTPDTPIEVESVGEYDETTGKYKIPIKVSGKHEPITTNIYLDEPLRKVGDYADYIKSVDLVNGTGTVARCVYECNMTEVFNTLNIKAVIYGKYTNVIRFSHNLNKMKCRHGKANCKTISNRFISANVNSFKADKECVFFHDELNTHFYTSLQKDRLGIGETDTDSEILNKHAEYVKNNDTKVYYALATPTETTITLPTLTTFKGTTVISADTTVQPSNAEIEYYSNVKE